MNWLERAKAKLPANTSALAPGDPIEKSGFLEISTANTAVRSLSAVMAVDFQEKIKKSGAANDPAPVTLSCPAPRIVREPPFGSDDVPPRYKSAWQAMLTQCSPVADPLVWAAAIYDSALLFGDFGAELARLGWTAGDLFDVPHDGRQGGLVWFIEGSPVVAIGQTVASTQDGRLYRRK